MSGSSWMMILGAIAAMIAPKQSEALVAYFGELSVHQLVCGAKETLDNYSNFILPLLYFMIPWTAINLVDFYLLRKSNYNIDVILSRDGEYSGVNWIAIVAYVVAVLVQFRL
ncbi:cytosine permease [Alicyclobacillus suci]|uniref:cytosine permease n=1 Tax=Alicyclobacillus suci TaxID=2816080 RepID=UPI001A8E4B72|nr:cytosine permease [Alicyclobacillus suci]